MSSDFYGDQRPTDEQLKEYFCTPAPGLSLPATAQEKELESYYTLSGLATNLPKLQSRSDVKQWLDDKELFRGHWEEFVKAYLEPARREAAAKGSKLYVRETLPEIKQAIRLGQANGIRRYSLGKNTNKTMWNSMAHCAFIVYNLTEINMNDPKGIFYGSDWTLDQCRHGIWQAIKYMTNLSDQSAQGGAKNNSSNAVPDDTLVDVHITSKPIPWTESA